MSICVLAHQKTSRANSFNIFDSQFQTSILFADLSGFTKWSSSKRPEEVFLLLETLYQAVSTMDVLRHSYASS